MIDGAPREIIGVVPEQVGLPRLAEVYLPLDELRAEDGVLRRGNHPGFAVLGRLKPGATLAQAADDMNRIARDLAQGYPDEDAGRTVSTRILLESAVADYRQSVWLLFAAVACVLLIACANVANLQLSQALTRTRELAVRRSWRESQPTGAATSDRKRLACSSWWHRRRVIFSLESRRHHRVEPAKCSALSGNSN